MTHRVSFGVLACAVMLPTAVLGYPFKTRITFDQVNGAIPVSGGLLIGGDGALYGTTAAGGSYRGGTVFKLTPSTGHGGGTLATLHDFSRPTGIGPDAGVVADAAGVLYGTAGNGAYQDFGTAYRLDPATGTYIVLHKFSGGADGGNPTAQLLLDGHGAAYGTTFDGGIGYGTLFKIDLSTGAFTTLHQFDYNHGSAPSGLVFDGHGALWGTTPYGGANANGAIFKFDPTTNVFLTPYSFDVSDGYFSLASLTLAPDGTFYGTTETGGDLKRCFIPRETTPGCGVVFNYSPKTGAFKIVYFFTGHADGAGPSAPVILDNNGLLYGTTAYGGRARDCDTLSYPNGCGTVFRLDPTTRAITTLHAFTGDADGANPYAPVAFTSTGTLVGTTPYGGNYTLCRATYHRSGCGTLYELTP